MNPIPLDEATAASLDIVSVTKIKRLDCVSYNDCLNIAVKNDWAGFGCLSCQAYTPIDQDQRLLDNIALRVVDQAAEYVVKTGNAHRVPGVKPGTNPRAKRRLPVLVERNEQATEIVPARLMVMG